VLLLIAMVVPAIGIDESSLHCCAAGVVHTLHALKTPPWGTPDPGFGFPLTTEVTVEFSVPE
jgi:hypothetical protein